MGYLLTSGNVACSPSSPRSQTPGGVFKTRVMGGHQLDDGVEDLQIVGGSIFVSASGSIFVSAHVLILLGRIVPLNDSPWEYPSAGPCPDRLLQSSEDLSWAR